jgi:GR25 family glycosyltransferase involved in LPS biosynthesis
MLFNELIKKVFNMPDNVKIGCYIIHLERATERELFINKLKEQLNIEFIDFKSADGEELIKEGHPCKSVEFDNMLCGAGNLGCTISHVNICKDAISKNFDYIIIFEDDCIFKRSIEELTEYLITTNHILKYNNFEWDLFLLGNNAHLDFIPLTNFLTLIKDFYGTHALIMTNRFANLLLLEHDKTFCEGKVKSADGLYSNTIKSNNQLLAVGSFDAEYFFEQKKGIHSYIVGGLRN